MWSAVARAARARLRTPISLYWHGRGHGRGAVLMDRPSLFAVLGH